MLIVLLCCCALGLAIAVNEDGYNEIVPSILFGEFHSTPQCPQGYSGQYPTCVPPSGSQYLSPLRDYLSPTPPPKKYIPPSIQCPPGSVGQIPFCRPLDRKYVPPTQKVQYPQQQCPAGTIGYYPDCQLPPTPPPPPTPTPPPPPQCPFPSVGQFPNCEIQQYTAQPQQCPAGTIGYYPDCQLPPTPPPPPTPTPPPPPQCPFPSVGQFPNCEIQQYTTPPPGCPLGTYGYYPNCLPTPPPPPPPLLSQCPFGTVGQYPDCRQLDECPPGSIGCQLEPPSLITPAPHCPFGSVGQFPDCQQSQQRCPPGMIGRYPFCISPPPPPPTTTTKKPTPTPTKRQPPQCPFPSVGTFPYCEDPQPSRKYLMPPTDQTPETEYTDGKPPLSWCIVGWDEYKKRYNKSYSTHQDVNRRVLFEKNQKLIESHNALYKKGEKTFSLCSNEFSDWTLSEYAGLLGIDYLELPYIPDTPDNNETDIFYKGDIGYEYDRPSTPQPQPQSIEGLGGGAGAPPTGADESILPEWDWRQHGAVTPIKNQGKCLSCWAFSAIAALESHLYIKKRKVEMLSEQQLIDCTRPLGNNGCHKGFMHKAFEYTQDNVISAQSEYPYLATDGALCRKALNGFESINEEYQNVTRGDEVLLKKAVYIHGPVSAGMDAFSEEFKTLGHYGIYKNNACTKRLNHAVLIIGYGFDNQKGMPYWIIKNSFGLSWGEYGFGRILRNENHCGIATLASYPANKNDT